MDFVPHNVGFTAADEEKQRQFVETTFPRLKNYENGEIDHLLFEDESMIRDYQAIQKTWFAKGNRESLRPPANIAVSSCLRRLLMQKAKLSGRKTKRTMPKHF